MDLNGSHKFVPNVPNPGAKKFGTFETNLSKFCQLKAQEPLVTENMCQTAISWKPKILTNLSQICQTAQLSSLWMAEPLAPSFL